jgi:hypothetical protein
MVPLVLRVPMSLLKYMFYYLLTQNSKLHGHKASSTYTRRYVLSQLSDRKRTRVPVRGTHVRGALRGFALALIRQQGYMLEQIVDERAMEEVAGEYGASLLPRLIHKPGLQPCT